MNNPNKIELEQDLFVDGEFLKKGTHGELVGMISTNLNDNTFSLGIKLKESGRIVFLSNDAISFMKEVKYKKYAY